MMGIEFVAVVCLGVASGAWLVVAVALAIDTTRTLLREWSPQAVATQAPQVQPRRRRLTTTTSAAATASPPPLAGSGSA